MMDNLKYEGPVLMNPFKCTFCDKVSKHKYLRRPNRAVAHLLDDNRWVSICKNCARKEIGSKNIKGWRKLHANA
tara:strand:+ start:238 stop:459 length:222 start_codon:yes stop_codon:yes gene_type:complete